MVVIFLPTASLSAVWQDLTASPLIWTVQAPQRPAPQPNLVPVICNCSRMTQRSGVSFAASTDMLCPLILRVSICFFPYRCMKPLTAATHCGSWLAPTGEAPSCAKNGLGPRAKQSKLELGQGEIGGG